MLADVFGLHVKTRTFHRHMSGCQFRDYRSLLDEHPDLRQDGDVAQPVRNLGESTIPFISDIGYVNDNKGICDSARHAA